MVKAFANLMQKQKSNLIDKCTKKGHSFSFERLLVKHNEEHTKAGMVGSYIILQAKKEYQHKNDVSI